MNLRGLPKYKDQAALYQTELSQQKLADRAGNDPAASCSTGKCSTTELTIQNQYGLGKRTRTSRLMLPKHALYQMSYTEKNWRPVRDSNSTPRLRRPVLCPVEPTRQKTKLGSRRWDRTIDHWLMRPALYH